MEWKGKSASNFSAPCSICPHTHNASNNHPFPFLLLRYAGIYICLRERERKGMFFLSRSWLHTSLFCHHLFPTVLIIPAFSPAAVSFFFLFAPHPHSRPSSTHPIPAHPIFLPPGECHHFIICIWETEQPLLSRCETNTSQSARQTRRFRILWNCFASMSGN
jgi:hypothetical protein